MSVFEKKKEAVKLVFLFVASAESVMDKALTTPHSGSLCHLRAIHAACQERCANALDRRAFKLTQRC
jgi:hypothetical protein